MAVFYVDSNAGNGGSGNAGSPFRSISQALETNLRPGDEIVVRAGIYTESLDINTGGSAAGDITLRAETPGEVFIRPNSGFNAISVNANYVTIEGFDIANAGGDGIEANGVHHITVRDNILHGNGESGIQFNYSEFIVVEGNTTYGNASSGWFSGISIYQNRNITGDTETEGFRTIVKNNVSYDNVTYAGAHTDGNGIIIDDFQSTQTGGFPNYTFPTLVEGNIAYGNGGKGIQVTWSDNVTVRGNTAWHNNVDPQNDGTWRGEISNSQSSNNTFVNNIMVADPGINGNNRAADNTSYGGYSNDNVIWMNNILFNGTNGQNSVRTDGGNAAPSAADGNLLGVNPLFVDPASGNFQLSGGSPAINAGTDAFGLAATDVDGDDRTIGTVDIGAQEAGSSPAAPTPPTTIAPPTSAPESIPTPEFEVTPAPEPTPVETPTEPELEDTGATEEPETETFSIWTNNETPAATATDDRNAVELGMKFEVQNDGEIAAVRVWRGESNDSDMPATLWDANGNVLATATFSDFDGSGWQEVQFSTPVSVQAGHNYVVSYHAERGNYAVSQNFFSSGLQSGPISIGEDAGVYRYGDQGSLPTQTTQDSNYWIDVVFEETVSAATPQNAIETLWDSVDTPDFSAQNDTHAVELGLEFEIVTGGEIEGFRVWRDPGNDETMPATLWDNNGNKIATATFTDTENGGWQEVSLDAPVSVVAGQKFVVSYHAPEGNYAVSQNYFGNGIADGAFLIREDAGVFNYGGQGVLPTQSYHDSNYWIDVVFDEADSSTALPGTETAELVGVATVDASQNFDLDLF